MVGRWCAVRAFMPVEVRVVLLLTSACPTSPSKNLFGAAGPHGRLRGATRKPGKSLDNSKLFLKLISNHLPARRRSPALHVLRCPDLLGGSCGAGRVRIRRGCCRLVGDEKCRSWAGNVGRASGTSRLAKVAAGESMRTSYKGTPTRPSCQ